MNDDGTPADIITVEYGGSIEASFKQLARAIWDDLMGSEKYKDCFINIFRRELMGPNRYVLDVAVIPSHAQSNIIVSYQVIESNLDWARFLSA